MGTDVLVVVAGAVGLLCAVLVGAAAAARARAAFERRFPPISDAEYLARCAPGTDPAVALKVRKFVADHFGIEYDRVCPTMRFVKDLGAD